jgi:diaminopimelate decarboxylase
MAEPEAGDFIAIGGAGAYCSAMSPMNYNSHVQAPEVLYTSDGELKVIRRRQTLEQIVINEIISVQNKES